MPGKKGNKNALGHKGYKPEKWTAEFYLNELNEIEKYIHSDEGKYIVFIIECCLYRGYSSNKWSEMKNKFADNIELLETIKRIEDFLEVRLYKAGLTNEVNSTMAIAGLNNKYRWANKYEHDLSGEIKTDNKVYGVLFEVVSEKDEKHE